MAAFGFKKQFVAPICLGLGIEIPEGFAWSEGMPLPKLQTIRAERKDKRRPKPSDLLQLYYGMRTRQCRLIGVAQCAAVLEVGLRMAGGFAVSIEGNRLADAQAEKLARNDGFLSLAEMEKFWRIEHGPFEDWRGVLIRWAPLAIKSG